MKFICVCLGFLFFSCNQGGKKDPAKPSMFYFEVGIKNAPLEWRDSSFVVATDNPGLLAQARAQLLLPVNQRKMINGALLKGDGGFNVNGPHKFLWHIKENDWSLAEISMEVCDGRPYTDVDLNLDYWINTVTRFCSWSSYIKKEL